MEPKKGGVFCGCFCIRGRCWRTDRMIGHLYVPRGFFTPPFETRGSLRARFSGMYASAAVENVGGIGRFRCVK